MTGRRNGAPRHHVQGRNYRPEVHQTEPQHALSPLSIMLLQLYFPPCCRQDRASVSPGESEMAPDHRAANSTLAAEHAALRAAYDALQDRLARETRAHD